VRIAAASAVAALLGALALALAAAVPARADAAPLIGIGDQHTQMFGDPHWEALGVRDVRFVAAWDALQSGWQRAELDQFMADARASGARVLLSFGHSRNPGQAGKLPSVAAYARQFAAFRSRYPWVRDFLTWNEANHCGQPTCHHPEQVARYYNAIRPLCAGCRIVGADVLDGSALTSWVKRFAKVAKGRLIWGLHNYIDANRFRTSGTRALLKAVKGDVWFTETGGLVMRNNGSSILFPGSVRHAANATTWVFKLAGLSSRVKRVYFYQWAPDTKPNPTWDSALMDSLDQPRPAYKVLSTWLHRHGIYG
jgi:hypothetical protein